MRKAIPALIIEILTKYLPLLENHDGLDDLFQHVDAPGVSPPGSKVVKTKAWLRRINKESKDPLAILGKIIESYMEIPEQVANWNTEFKDKLEGALIHYKLTYRPGGFISDGSSALSKSLAEHIKGRDIPAIDDEFTRALNNVDSDPREAVSAACNILESIFKTYIADKCLPQPNKQDLQNVWKIVRADLGFDPKLVQDDDLKKILTGILSVVDGIGAYRTHASSAHGQGRKIYKIKPRHARLAVHSAHTIALFVLETWDEKCAIKC